jgi:raffinose/stachyose/melibiose transport system substrate-binding protein
MSHHRDLLGSRLNRRTLGKTTGGLALLAAMGVQVSPRRAFAQDATTVTMWGNHPEWNEPMENLLAAFMTAHPEVAVEFSATPGQDYPAKLSTALSGGQPSDIVGELEGAILSRAFRGEAMSYADLTGKIDLSGLTDTARQQVSVNGVDYGCPLASYTVGLAYQRPIFEQNGITPPTTWDEFRAACQTLQEAGVQPLVLGAKDGVHPFFMYIGLTSSVLGPEGFEAIRTGEKSLTDADALTGADFLLELQQYFQPGFEATDYVAGKAIFAQGLGAMMVAGTADFTGFKQENPDADLGFMAWPGPEAGKYATNTGFELLYTAYNGAEQAKQDAAATFINWLATQEAQQIVSDTISLPVHSAITESSDAVRQETVQARGKDVTVWYALPETGATFDAVSQNHGGLWTGRLNTQQFAQAIQDSITPSAG